MSAPEQCFPQNPNPRGQGVPPTTTVGITQPRAPMNAQDVSTSHMPTAVGMSALSQGCWCPPNYPNYSQPLQARTLGTQPPTAIGKSNLKELAVKASLLPPSLSRFSRPSVVGRWMPTQTRSPQVRKDGYHTPTYPPGRGSALPTVPQGGTTIPTTPRGGTTMPAMPRSSATQKAPRPRD